MQGIQWQELLPRGVDGWWSAWLQASGFHEEVQTKLKNLPYTGEFIGEQVEATLQRAKERQAMLCFLRSVYCPLAPPAAGLGRRKLLYISWLSRPLFVSRMLSALLVRVPTTVAEQGALHPLSTNSKNKREFKEPETFHW